MKARTKMKTLLLLGVLLFGFTVSAQSQKVSLDFKNERVEKVLASIKSPVSYTHLRAHET